MKATLHKYSNTIRNANTYNSTTRNDVHIAFWFKGGFALLVVTQLFCSFFIFITSSQKIRGLLQSSSLSGSRTDLSTQNGISETKSKTI